MRISRIGGLFRFDYPALKPGISQYPANLILMNSGHPQEKMVTVRLTINLPKPPFYLVVTLIVARTVNNRRAE